MNIACRNSDCKSQRTESVCLTKANRLKLLRENIDVHYASHVQYEHLHIVYCGQIAGLNVHCILTYAEIISLNLW
jgi:hypothetical protein